MTVLWVTGWEHGVNPITSGSGLCTSLYGTCTADATIKRSGNYALKTVGTASQSYILKNIEASDILVERFYINFGSSMPAASTYVHVVYANDTTFGDIYYNATSGKLQVLQTGQTAVDGPVVTTNTWYRIDIMFTWGNNTHSIQWAVDGVAQTTFSVSGQAIASITQTSFGNRSTTTATLYYDDVIVANNNASDYPYGAGVVVGLSPNADGTHNAGTNIIEDESLNDIGVVTAWNLIDDVPMSSTSDRVQQTANGATNYAEVAFADTTQTTIQGVMGLLAYNAAGTSYGTGGTIMSSDNFSSYTTIYGNPSTVADYSESTIFYKGVMLAVPSGGWTTTLVNAIKARIGYSTDASPDIYWQSLMIEVAYAEATGSTTPKSLAGSIAIASVVVRKSKKPAAGIAGSSGVAIKKSGRILTGAVSEIGNIFKRTTRDLTGAVISSGSVAKKLLRTLVSSVSSSGTIAGLARYVRLLSGAIQSSGSQYRKVATTRTGVVTSSGAGYKKTKTSRVGAVTSSSVLLSIKKIVVLLSGTASSIGAVVIKTKKSVAGLVESAGISIKKVLASMGGDVSAAGSILYGKKFIRLLLGSVDTAGAISRSTKVHMVGALATAGGLLRKIRKFLVGVVSSVGTRIASILSLEYPGTVTLVNEAEYDVTLTLSCGIIVLVDELSMFAVVTETNGSISLEDSTSCTLEVVDERI